MSVQDKLFKKSYRHLSQMYWDYPNPFTKKKDTEKSKNNMYESAEKEKNEKVFCSNRHRYRICTDKKPSHNIVLKKLKYEEEKLFNDVSYLQPGCTPLFMNKN